MMTQEVRDETALIAEMRREALDSVEDRLHELRSCVENFSDGRIDAETAFDQMRQQIHSLKGIGASFALPVLAEVAHRFEDYIATKKALRREWVGNLHVYTDRLEEAVEEFAECEVADACALLEKLPMLNAESELL